MKITIKKVSLLVVALAAVYFVVPAKALNKKELQAREEAVKNFLKKSDLSREKDESAYVALVDKLKNTMFSHRIPQYLALFDAQLASNALDKLRSYDVSSGDFMVDPKDIREIKVAFEKMQKAFLGSSASATLQSEAAENVIYIMLDAIRMKADFKNGTESNKYRKAIRAIFEDEPSLKPRDGAGYALDTKAGLPLGEFKVGTVDTTLSDV